MNANEDKVRAFVTRIVEECEQEGFTMGDALRIPQELKFALYDRLSEIQQCVDIRGFRVDP